MADSTSRPNTALLPQVKVLAEGFGWCLPAGCLAGAGVEGVGDGGQVAGGVAGEVGALGEVLAEQAVGVLVGAALPGWVRVGEVDGQAGAGAQLGVLGHL